MLEVVQESYNRLLSRVAVRTSLHTGCVRASQPAIPKSIPATAGRKPNPRKGKNERNLQLLKDYLTGPPLDAEINEETNWARIFFLSLDFRENRKSVT